MIGVPHSNARLFRNFSECKEVVLLVSFHRKKKDGVQPFDNCRRFDRAFLPFHPYPLNESCSFYFIT
jgi:hypothetical protein